MKLNLKKTKDQYKVLIEKNGEKPEKFEYIKFINLLYAGEEIEEVAYDENISQEERNQLDKMINDINTIVKGEN